jgi:hypothetical protein
MSDTPFDSVEGAHEYVGLLLDALREARGEVEQDLTTARTDGATRRLEALQLVAWKLERLELHLASSRHLLNDLRRLRDLLLAEPVSGTAREPRPAPDDPWEEP